MKNAEWLLKCKIPFDQIYCEEHVGQFPTIDHRYDYDIIWKVNPLEPSILLGHVDCCIPCTDIEVFQKWLGNEVDMKLIDRYKEAIGKLNIL